jgi:hypothetical protein
MSWSLRLSQRLSPAVLLGVSQETFQSARMSGSSTSVNQPALRLRTFSPTHNFPEQLSAPCGARLALGVPTKHEELPITAA